MKKQLYKIGKTDWCVSCGFYSDGTWMVEYTYTMNLKEAKARMKVMEKEHKECYLQLFKLSYEFRDVKVKKAK